MDIIAIQLPSRQLDGYSDQVDASQTGFSSTAHPEAWFCKARTEFADPLADTIVQVVGTKV
jgi:hypothetical protein